MTDGENRNGTLCGETLGSYRLVRVIGQGGMGVVYYGEHVLIGTKAAIKVLRRDFSGEREFVARLFNEARAAALVNHPGMVQVFDFGSHASGCPYLVMEYLQGETLSSRLKRERTLPPSVALAVARQIASAVGAAHDAGIVHRDLKPDNVFLLPDPEMPGGVRVKILDFGIAKLHEQRGPDASDLTRTGRVMGTPSYMSPEQCRGAGDVDWRSDIYSLGCVIYAMVCGRKPFDGEGPGDVIAAHLRQPPVPPRVFEPSLPPALETLIMNAMAKRPEHRQVSMTALLAELDTVTWWRTTASSSGQSGAAEPANTTLHDAAGEASSGASDLRRWSTRTRLVLGAGSILGAASAALVVAALAGPNDRPPRADDDSTKTTTGPHPAATTSPVGRPGGQPPPDHAATGPDAGMLLPPVTPPPRRAEPGARPHAPAQPATPAAGTPHSTKPEREKTRSRKPRDIRTGTINPFEE